MCNLYCTQYLRLSRFRVSCSPLASPMHHTPGTTLPFLSSTCILSFTGTNPLRSVSAPTDSRFNPCKHQTSHFRFSVFHRLIARPSGPRFNPCTPQTPPLTSVRFLLSHWPAPGRQFPSRLPIMHGTDWRHHGVRLLARKLSAQIFYSIGFPQRCCSQRLANAHAGSHLWALSLASMATCLSSLSPSQGLSSCGSASGCWRNHADSSFFVLSCHEHCTSSPCSRPH